MSPNNGYKTTCNTIPQIHRDCICFVAFMAIFLSSKHLFFLSLDRIGQNRENEIKIQDKSNCASSVCVQTNAPRARWGSTPIPFDITGRTDDELSIFDTQKEPARI